MAEPSSSTTFASPAEVAQAQRANAWRNLQAALPAAPVTDPAPRPVVPPGSPSEFVPLINRAYQSGSIAFNTNNLTLEPPKPSSSPAAPQPSTATGTQSGPMDLSAGRRKGPLSDKEKAHRRANNLCMYCGKSGHFASTCPLGKGKQRANSAVTPGTTPAPAPAAPVPANASVMYVLGSQSKN
jgi:hypothetical protein